jgi:hypothetical protein
MCVQIAEEIGVMRHSLQAMKRLPAYEVCAGKHAARHAVR